MTDNPRLIEFAAFLVAETGTRRYPDYWALGLMRIAPLVRHVWAIDFRNGIDDRPKLCFTGTHIDDHYGMNITGKSFEEIYVEDDFDDAIRGNCYQVYAQRTISYTRRLAQYFDDRVDKNETIEAMLFPCAADDETIDYGVGFVEYSHGQSPPEKVFELI